MSEKLAAFRRLHAGQSSPQRSPRERDERPSRLEELATTLSTDQPWPQKRHSSRLISPVDPIEHASSIAAPPRHPTARDEGDEQLDSKFRDPLPEAGTNFHTAAASSGLTVYQREMMLLHFEEVARFSILLSESRDRCGFALRSAHESAHSQRLASSELQIVHEKLLEAQLCLRSSQKASTVRSEQDRLREQVVARDVSTLQELQQRRATQHAESLARAEDRRARELRAVEATYETQLALQRNQIEQLKTALADREYSLQWQSSVLDRGCSVSSAEKLGDVEERSHSPQVDRVAHVQHQLGMVQQLACDSHQGNERSLSSSLSPWSPQQSDPGIETRQREPVHSSPVTPHHGAALISTHRNAWKQQFLHLDSTGWVNCRESVEAPRTAQLFHVDLVIRLRPISTPMQSVALSIHYRPSPNAAVSTIEIAFDNKQTRNEWIDALRPKAHKSLHPKLQGTEKQTSVQGASKLGNWLSTRLIQQETLHAVTQAQRELIERR